MLVVSSRRCENKKFHAKTAKFREVAKSLQTFEVSYAALRDFLAAWREMFSQRRNVATKLLINLFLSCQRHNKFPFFVRHRLCGEPPDPDQRHLCKAFIFFDYIQSNRLL